MLEFLKNKTREIKHISTIILLNCLILSISFPTKAFGQDECEYSPCIRTGIILGAALLVGAGAGYVASRLSHNEGCHRRSRRSFQGNHGVGARYLQDPKDPKGSTGSENLGFSKSTSANTLSATFQESLLNGVTGSFLPFVILPDQTTVFGEPVAFGTSGFTTLGPFNEKGEYIIGARLISSDATLDRQVGQVQVNINGNLTQTYPITYTTPNSEEMCSYVLP